ncbi:hypothetical protein B1A99_02660 [Cohnella sp. CIP 111063]|jgi:DNA-binding PadR family transcriptional regulator|uniref:PadR family transcriptional regulator n=1 Tax=unclassified Cohnella TaxID=2636738 RepID=UPI000B8C3B73|nr:MULTISPECIES: PadR family transcriptional regulator [unclassified Cohnella]OXS62770.1 hypothetical protein B1A99_02660 [Cohnella sp. CIP 111063]PRX75048.1 PadR family transcriptional regulator [Cohnella sp. SGD-V74]
MDFVLLGFLMIRDLSAYEMRKILQRKVSPFYSASLGSIQTTLKKLEDNGLIRTLEMDATGRRKKLYRIDEPGRRGFAEKMFSEIAAGRLEQDITTRLFFLGLLDAPDRLKVARSIAASLESVLGEYDAAAEEAARAEVPESLRQIAVYQIKTLELAIALYRSMLEWFRRFQEQLEGDPDAGEEVEFQKRGSALSD